MTLGHQTRMAWPQFFGEPDGDGCTQAELLAGMFERVGKHARCRHEPFDTSREYAQQDKLHGLDGAHKQATALPPYAHVEHSVPCCLFVET